MITRQVILSGALVALLCAIGCGSATGPRIPVHPVSGEVMVKGQPAANARVLFRAQDRADGPALESEAITDLAGKFQMTTYEPGDGLPPGKYAVRIIWPEVMTDDPATAGDKLKGAYNDAKKAAFVVEVKAEKNQLPRFDLK